MEVFQVKAKIRKRLRNCKRRIQHRLRKKQWADQRRRLFRDHNIHYDLSDKTRGLHCGGIGAMHLLVQKLDFADVLDSRLHLLKRHVPYFESDHVLNMTYNLLAGGKCLEDIELLRTNETYLNLLGAPRIPDPTTERDFLRRFAAEDVETLQEVLNDRRLRVWQQQPPDFFAHAIIEGDGTLAETSGQCKEGMDLAYDGTWGYHPLLVSLANTQEPLFLYNRPASRPSHDQAAAYFDRALALCRTAGFRAVSFRGDTDFTQTQHLDRWDAAAVRFVFGIDAMPNLVALAQALPPEAWQALPRPAAYVVKTRPRQRPTNVKEQVVRQKGYTNIILVSEQVAECPYRPGACRRDYRLVVVRKQLRIEEHGEVQRHEVRYFFYLTNEETWTLADLVAFANDRGNQENLIEQLKNGVRALRLPVNTLVSNWAYMVIGALAWTLKAWLALLQPRAEQRRALLTMEFKKFLQELMLLPSQVLRAGGRLVYRLLQWNPWVEVLFRGVEVLRSLRIT
jgi:Transposase DDE domain group 1